jgi:hypothetical protein
MIRPEIPQCLDALLGAGDDDGVEAEQESGKGGGERPVEELAGGLHRLASDRSILAPWALPPETTGCLRHSSR